MIQFRKLEAIIWEARAPCIVPACSAFITNDAIFGQAFFPHKWTNLEFCTAAVEVYQRLPDISMIFHNEILRNERLLTFASDHLFVIKSDKKHHKNEVFLNIISCNLRSFLQQQ